MEHWDLTAVDVDRNSPAILHSVEEGRTVLLALPGGEELREHEVHERAWVIVVQGEVEIECGGETVRGGTGLLALFAPKERHTVRALDDSRLLLVLAPWPGEGHPRRHEG